MNILTDRLRELRESKDLYQKDIADSIGKEESTYSKYEQGTREPDIDTLIKIADFYNVTVDFLIGHEDKTKLSKDDLLEQVKYLESYLMKMKNYIINTK